MTENAIHRRSDGAAEPVRTLLAGPKPPTRPVVPVGIAAQWSQAAFVVRGCAHVAAAALSTSGRSWKLRAGALATSLTIDAGIALRAGTPGRDRRTEALANAVDGALWATWSRDDPLFARTIAVGTVVPSVMETAYRLAAGTDAVPVVQPAKEWRPAWDPPLPRLLSLPWAKLPVVGPRRWLRDRREEFGATPRPDLGRMAELVRELVVDAAPPLISMWTARRVGGRRLGAGPLGWATLAAAGGYALARTRDDAHRTTTELWAQRTAAIIEADRVLSRQQSRLLHNLALDPKSLLRQLADLGSTRAADAHQRLVDASAAVSEAIVDDLGTTLVDAVDNRAVVPHDDRCRWVPFDAIAPLRAQLEAVDDELELAAEDDELGQQWPTGMAYESDQVEVVAARGSEIALRYRGRQITIERPLPDLQIRLDPVIPTIGIGMVWAAVSISDEFGGVPAGMIVPSLALQGMALWRLMSRPVHDRHADEVTALLVAASSIALDVVYGLRQRRTATDGGFPLVPGTAATQGLALLIGTSWSDLRRVRWPLVAAAGAGWLFAFAGPRGRRDRLTMVSELAYVLMPALATITTTADLRREAEALDDHLDQCLAWSVEAAAREAGKAGVAEFEEILRAVIDEVGLLEPVHGADTVGRIRSTYAAELDRLARTDILELLNY